MAKLTLTDGTIFEGTTEELFAITQKFGGATEEVADEPEELRVGDRAKIVNANYSTLFGFKTGDLVEIVDNPHGEDDEDYRVKHLSEGFVGYTLKSDKYIVKVADKQQVEPLKVGDSVIVSGKSIFGVDLDGKLGVYEGASVTYAPSHARVNTNGERTCVVKYEQIRKVTDEEVEKAAAKAEALAKQAIKDAIFTQAGRKPNEYRKGDIVTGYGIHRGETVIGEFSDVGSTIMGVVDARGFTAIKDFHPVSFVESRLDRK